MHKLTYKAIAWMAGYRVESYPSGYYWKNLDDDSLGYKGFMQRDEAYKACCIDNGLLQSN